MKTFTFGLAVFPAHDVRFRGESLGDIATGNVAQLRFSVSGPSRLYSFNIQ